MTDIQKRRIEALSKISTMPGTAKNRFIKNMKAMLNDNPDREISELQDKYLAQLCYHFRRQLPKDIALKEKP